MSKQNFCKILVHILVLQYMICMIFYIKIEWILRMKNNLNKDKDKSKEEISIASDISVYTCQNIACASLLGIKKGGRIFFVGIGGYSMCGLAQICHQAGYSIAGSDKESSHRTQQLIDKGIQVFSRHSRENVLNFKPDCVVYTVAVPLDNPELIAAKELEVPVYERSFFLGGINRIFNKVINISGTHGKTTTTTMCALILEESGLDPTAHIGAEVESWESPVRIGRNQELFVSEACEYNSSFLQFFSTTAAILNIDHDHVDCFPKIEDVITVFGKFACTLPEDGYLVIPSFDPHINSMLSEVVECRHANNEKIPRIVTFGKETDLFLKNNPDFYISNYDTNNGYPMFDVYHGGNFFCHIEMVIPGFHNALNALAAIACSVLNKATPEACEKVLNNFHGADNRFSEVGVYKGAKVISDYAHHPSAIRVSYQAAQSISNGHNVWAVFQPITYSRAIGLFKEFSEALKECQQSYIFEVYTSREANTQGFSSSMICDNIKTNGGKCEFLTSFEDLESNLRNLVSPGDVILIMGPEGMKEYAKRLVQM